MRLADTPEKLATSDLVVRGATDKYRPPVFKVETLSRPTEGELRRPFLYRYFVRIPEAGKFSFFDGSWMDEVTKARLLGETGDNDYRRQLTSIKRFERQLSDNGYLVVKFFFHISKGEQKKRLAELEDNKSTSWRVEKWDRWQNKHYEKCVDVYDEYLEATNQFIAPWYFIDSKSRKWAELQVTELLVKSIDIALQNTGRAATILQNTFPLKQMPKLSEFDLSVSISDEEYSRELDELQAKLADLHNRIYHRKIPVIIAYEGWDAAGKGGNIKRITGADLRYIRSLRRSRERKTATICGVSGIVCRRTDISLSLTVLGTAA